MENQMTYWTELALKIPKLFISTITAKVSTGSGEILEQSEDPKTASWHKPDIVKIPFGVQFKDIMTIVAFICTGQTNPCRLCRTGSTSVAGKHSLSLHITLKQSTHGREYTVQVTSSFLDKMTPEKINLSDRSKQFKDAAG